MPHLKNDRLIFKHLDELFKSSIEIPVKPKDKWVLFSDLHVGNGTSKDDFKPNANLFIYVLQKYYLENNFSLILNGDVEELQRFPEDKVIGAWPGLYWLFDEFHQKNALIKTIGNHDLSLLLNKGKDSRYPLHHAVKMKWNDHNIFVFHGHQASDKYLKYNRLLGITLKYLANPLRIKNFSVAHSSRKQFAIEKKVYDFSVFKKIVSIIGHTHRPLFESLSKVERLKYKIEQLSRRYADQNKSEEQKKIKKSIKTYKKDLIKMYKKDKESFLRKSVYNTIVTVPCLYNSGCVIGKRGITALEIENGQIRLIHWFDENTSKRYLNNYGYEPIQLADSDFYRMIINEENLDYIFSRINLLA